MLHRTGKTRAHWMAAGAMIGAVGSIVGFAPPALAQTTASADQVEEVVVTARRREERLQDAPVAVTAFSAEALADRGVESVAEISKFTPNLRFDGAAQLSGGNYNATVFIRGVGQNDFAIFSDPGVGIYVDGVYFARSIGGMLDAFDVGRIEVLRGPQGTLFGKNTIGGAVVITSQAPGPELAGRLEGTVGSFNRRDLKGYLDLPITENLFARISGGSLNRDGYAHRLSDGQDLGDRNADAARLQLRWDASDDLRFDLSADYTRAREHSAPQTLIAVANRPGFTGAPFMTNFNTFVAPTLGIVAPNGARTLNPSFITGDPYTTWGSGPNVNDLDLWGVSGTVNWDLGKVQAKSITAYRHLKAQFARDGDNSPFTFRHTRNWDKQRQFSHEFQFNGEGFDGRLTWVAGLYYFNEHGSDRGYAHLALGLGAPATPPPVSPSANVYTVVDATTYAAFAQGSFSLTDNLSLTLGGRSNKDEKSYYLDHRRIADGFIVANTTVSDSWSAFTPKVGMEFKASPDVLLYVSAGKGFKSGGFNARPLTDITEVTPYQPETIRTYELGAKTAWFDRRLVLNAAACFSQYDDIQVTVNQTPRNFVANAAAGEIKGFEVEVVARPAPGWDLNLAVGHTKTKYTEVGLGLGPTQILPINLKTRFVKSPEWTASAGVQRRIDLGQAGGLTLRGDLSYFGKYYNDIANDPDLAQGAYSLVGARITWDSPDDLWRVEVFGTNLTDEQVKVSGNASSAAFGLKEASYGPPMEWGVSLAREF